MGRALNSSIGARSIRRAGPDQPVACRVYVRAIALWCGPYTPISSEPVHLQVSRVNTDRYGPFSARSTQSSDVSRAKQRYPTRNDRAFVFAWSWAQISAPRSQSAGKARLGISFSWSRSICTRMLLAWPCRMQKGRYAEEQAGILAFQDPGER